MVSCAPRTSLFFESLSANGASYRQNCVSPAYLVFPINNFAHNLLSKSYKYTLLAGLGLRAFHRRFAWKIKILLLPRLRSIDSEDVPMWALPEGAIARLGRGSVRDMAFSPDGQYFAVGTSIGLWLYELPTLSPIALWNTERGMTDDVTFSPDSHRIVMRTFAGNLIVWNIQSGTFIAQMEEFDNQEICPPVFSQDGQRLVAADYRMKNRKIYVWDSHTGKQVKETEIHHSYKVYPLCFSPDLSLLAGKNSDPDNIGRNIGDGDSITVWQVDTGEQIANITGYSERVRKFCFSPCEQFLAVGGWHGTIHVWDVVSGQLETSYTDHGESQMYPYFLPDGELITAAVSERQIEIWHVEKGEKLDEFEHRGSRSTVHFSDSGTQLALANPCEIQIWTKGNNSDAHTLLTLHGHISTMDTLVFFRQREDACFCVLGGQCAFMGHQK